MNHGRINNFLCNYEFISNNIEFRIISSKALERFKNAQAFQLGELVNGKFHFPQERRELLLLEYDIVTRWLGEIERSIIEDSIIDVESILEFAAKGRVVTLDTIADNPDKFDREFTKIFSTVREQGFVQCMKLIEEIDQTSIGEFFTELVDLVILAMEHMMVEIHELNSIIPVNHKMVKNEDVKYVLDSTPNIYITSMSVNSFEKFNFGVTKHRLAVYKEYLEFGSIIIKNVSNSKISDDILNNIETVVNVDYKASVYC